VRADLMSMSEAAEEVGCHVETLYRLSREGQFPPALMIGSRWRVSRPRLERFLHSEGPEGGDAR
jgi:excisionase family DNA binding protein